MPYFKTTDRCSLYYEIKDFESSKPVLVFLNGTTQTTLNWRTHAVAMKERFRVLMYDARASGASEVGTLPLSPECHISDLSALLGHLNIQKANMSGVSHGAYLASAFASALPERTERLVLFGVGAKRSCRAEFIIKSWAEILKCAGLECMARASLPMIFGEDFLKKNKGLIDGMVKALVRRNNKESLLAHLEAMLEYPPLSQTAHTISAPCLVISGSDDPLVPETAARELADLCKGRYEQIIGAGHSVPAEVPERFHNILHDFL